MFKIKDGYKLELQTPKTIKLFDSTKISIDQTNSLQVAEVVLVQWNLLDNHFQKLEILLLLNVKLLLLLNYLVKYGTKQFSVFQYL